MKLRPNHVVLFVLLVIVSIVALAFLRSGTQAKTGTDDFLAEVRQIRESGKGSHVSDGIVPPKVELDDVPKIAVDSLTFDMGLIPNHEMTSKKMPVYNRGTRPLEIIEIRTSCGCTHGGFENARLNEAGRAFTVIPPGGQDLLTITVDPARIPGFKSVKQLTISSNDPKTPQLVVDVAARVDPEYEVIPALLDFGDVEKGDVIERTAIIRQIQEKPFRITTVEAGLQVQPHTGLAGARSSPGEVRYTVDVAERPQSEWANPDKKEWLLKVALTPMVPPGQFIDNIRVHSDIPRLNSMEYEIRANVKTFFAVEPNVLNVKNPAFPGAETVGSAQITADRPFEITNLRVSGDDLVVRWKPGEKSNTAEIDVDVAPGADAGVKMETITFNVEADGRSVPHSIRAFVPVRLEAS